MMGGNKCWCERGGSVQNVHMVNKRFLQVNLPQGA